MTKKNEKKFYETSGIDWNDEESIMEFARKVWSNFVEQSDFQGGTKLKGQSGEDTPVGLDENQEIPN